MLIPQWAHVTLIMGDANLQAGVGNRPKSYHAFAARRND